MTTINARIKKIRKKAGMNQKEFSEKVGITQSGVSYMEQDGRNVSDITIKSICNYFNINETWLRNGLGNMQTKDFSFSLDQFVQEHKGTGLEIEVMKAYFELDPGIRQQIVEHFKTRLSAPAPPSQGDVAPSTPEALEETYPSIEDTGSQVS